MATDQIEIVGSSVFRIAEGHYTKVEGLEVFNGSVYLEAVADSTMTPTREVGYGLTAGATQAIARLMSVSTTPSGK
jgi:hypothetical protein